MAPAPLAVSWDSPLISNIKGTDCTFGDGVVDRTSYICREYSEIFFLTNDEIQALFRLGFRRYRILGHLLFYPHKEILNQCRKLVLDGNVSSVSQRSSPNIVAYLDVCLKWKDKKVRGENNENDFHEWYGERYILFLGR